MYIWATSELERQLGSAPATGVVRVTAATAGQQLKVYDYAQPVTSIQVGQACFYATRAAARGCVASAGLCLRWFGVSLLGRGVQARMAGCAAGTP